MTDKSFIYSLSILTSKWNIIKIVFIMNGFYELLSDKSHLNEYHEYFSSKKLMG